VLGRHPRVRGTRRRRRARARGLEQDSRPVRSRRGFRDAAHGVLERHHARVSTSIWSGVRFDFGVTLTHCEKTC